ncbi:MAG: preprotein translocase subunit SecY [Verrucomicrobiales bacterium]
MISAFRNIFHIPELRNRIIFTLLMIVVIRFGTAITLPGVDSFALDKFIEARLLEDDATRGGAAVAALLNVFSGGALSNCAIFALGVMPYISASIMMQLLTAVVPQLGRLARQEGGRSKINQYTRLVTIGLAILQGFFLVKSLVDPSTNPFLGGFDVTKYGPLVPNPDWVYYLSATTTIVAGTMLLMWMGEQITERGIGNGVSLIIAVNIIHNFPAAIIQIWNKYVKPALTGATDVNPLSPAIMVMLLVFMIVVIAGVIAITQAQRRVPIAYAKRMVGRKMLGGQKQYMPLKVNYAGVMPIIFAQAILTFPMFLSPMFASVNWLQTLLYHISSPNAVTHYIILGLMIFFFSYFWVATMFQPGQIAEELKKNGGYIPGVRPGKPTADFLDFSMSRLTFAGSIFLTIIAVLPTLISLKAEVPPVAAQFFGGTSILILVGVLLDIMRQMETHLLQRHYDGFLRRGKIRGRFDKTKGLGTGNAASSKTTMWLAILAAILVLLGAAAMLTR